MHVHMLVLDLLLAVRVSHLSFIDRVIHPVPWRETCPYHSISEWCYIANTCASLTVLPDDTISTPLGTTSNIMWQHFDKWVRKMEEYYIASMWRYSWR